ncbi:MAG TPA: FtsX-like permease family protein [Planctomycetaceae bacterium]|nr:FtsX-like permease family protein [Planctomycetaceae bacterium]
MNLLTIAWKSIRQRALASSLTGLSVALGVMLMVAVLVTYSVVQESFAQKSIGYDLVLGRRGSDLQLVLSTVYRVGDPPPNVPYTYYLKLKNRELEYPREMRFVEAAVPIAMGDVTKEGAFPIIGTTGEYFTHEYVPGREFGIRGDIFRQPFDAIIGHRVARENRWNLGSQFTLVHGGAEGHDHDEKFTVVGVLAPTGTANDRTVFIHLNGFYAIAGHDTPPHEAYQREAEFYGREVDQAEFDRLQRQWEREQSQSGHHHHRMEDWQKQLSAIFITVRNRPSAYLLLGTLRKGSGNVMAVNPVDPMRDLMTNVVGNVATAMLVLTGLVVVVSGISIFVSIYNSMSERRREIAIMRALGAQRRTVFSIILAESVLLCFGGGLLGVVLGHGIVFFAAPFVEIRTGLIINPLTFHPWEAVLLPALVVLASLVGFLPGLSAYRTDVARTLAE